MRESKKTEGCTFAEVYASVCVLNKSMRECVRTMPEMCNGGFA